MHSVVLFQPFKEKEGEKEDKRQDTIQLKTLRLTRVSNSSKIISNSSNVHLFFLHVLSTAGINIFRKSFYILDILAN